MKTLFKVFALVGILAFSNLLLPILAGLFLVLKATDLGFSLSRSSWRHRMGAAAAGATADEVVANRVGHRAKTRRRYFIEKENRWDQAVLPHTMFAGNGGRGRRCTFTCCGLENAVRGEYLGSSLVRGQDMRFSMDFSSSRLARELNDFISRNGIVGTSVEHHGDSFRVTCDNPQDMADIVAEFYPPRTMKVEREVTVTRQYSVRASSASEAAAVVARGGGSCLGEYTVSVDTVDGVRQPPQQHQQPPWSDGRLLEAGTYVVEAAETRVYSRDVEFHASYDSTDEALRSDASDHYISRFDDSQAASDASRRCALGLMECRQSDLVEDRCTAEPVISVIETGMSDRYVMDGSRTVSLVDVGDRDCRIPEAGIRLSFSSLEGLLSVARGDTPVTGWRALVDGGASPSAGEDYVLTLPLDARSLACLSPADGSLERLRAACPSAGIPDGVLEASCICSSLSEGDAVTAVFTSEPGMSRALINGVPLTSYLEREEAAAEGRVREFAGEDERKEWLREAACIKEVRMELDLSASEMVMHSDIEADGGLLHFDDRLPLTREETAALSRRPDMPDGELRDLLMARHQELFGFHAGVEAAAHVTSVLRSYAGLAGEAAAVAPEVSGTAARRPSGLRR